MQAHAIQRIRPPARSPARPQNRPEKRPEARRASGIPGLIEAIATDRLGDQLLALLHDECGVDHCSVFSFRGERLERLASASLDGTDTALNQVTLYLQGQHWRQDPTITEARRRSVDATTSLIRSNIAALPAGDLRDVIYGRTSIQERIMICGTRGDEVFGISALHSDQQGAFSERQIARLEALADTLISVLAKHAEIMRRPAKAAVNLTSLPEIVAKISAAPEVFPRREAEVCARILYGLSTTGIALDIGIGEESVVTYRKRAFFRLGIATRRELLLWYLSL
jgi:DNA-binding NarL/FixJ family response regulator